MKSGVKAAIGATVVLVLAVGGELAYLHHERNKPMVMKAPEREKIADDDLVFLKQKRPSSMADLKELVGTTVWVSAGGQLDYYPYAGKTVEYGKSAGTLLGAQSMVVKGRWSRWLRRRLRSGFRVGTGRCCWFLRCRDAADAAKEYAVPVGYRQDGQYTFYTDEIFFYDDPHELYKHWGPEIWKAVDAHQRDHGDE